MSKNSQLYTSNTKRRETKSSPNRLVTLLYEARWLAMGVVLVYLFLTLATYSKLDPGWSHSTVIKSYINWGGPVGAWTADLFLFTFGLSAWWFCVLLGRAVWSSYPRLWQKIATPDTEEIFNRLPLELTIRSTGFVMMLLGSAGIEYVRMYSVSAQLPRCPGGVIGQLIGGSAQQYLGFTGGTLLLFLMFAVGFSVFFQVSWLNFVEVVGEIIENMVLKTMTLFKSYQDRRVGQAASIQRDEAVQARVAAGDAGPKVEPIFVADEVTHIERTEPVFAPFEPVVAATPEPAPTRFEQPAAPLVIVQPDPAPVVATSVVSATPVAPAPVVPTQVNEPLVPRVIAEPMNADLDSDELDEDMDEEGITVLTDIIHPEPTAPAQILQPAAPLVIAPQVTEVQMSNRAQKEKLQSFAKIGSGQLPPLSLLDPAPASQEIISVETLEFTSRLIEKKLKDFGVEVHVVAAYPGPVVTRYEIEPATGVKGSQIVGLARDLARALSITSIRVVETIPGKNYMGLELPNQKRQIVRLTEIIGSQLYHDNQSSLTVALGKDIAGLPVTADLAKMPHLLVAGTTGSGKSVGINATILSLLYKSNPEDVRMILIDPKMLELSIYEGIPHLLAPVVTDMRQAAHALNWAVAEMERRYKLMSKLGVRNLAGFNAKIAAAQQMEQYIPNPLSVNPEDPEPLTKLPTIVIVIDELADLMMVVGKKVEELIARIAQKARAAGVHLILATQRPSVDVITGLIKANIPTRIAFQVSSKIDSRTILDQMGAESLLGMGDMLYMPPGTGMPLRVHGAFVSDDEVHRVVEFCKAQGEPDYVEGILEGGVGEGGLEGAPGAEPTGGENDALYDEAVAVVLKHRRASISLVQRHLRIGYNRAARILEQMEQSGVVSPMQTNGNRDILVPATPQQ